MQWYIILTTGCFIADFTVTPQGRTKSRNQTASRQWQMALRLYGHRPDAGAGRRQTSDADSVPAQPGSVGKERGRQFYLPLHSIPVLRDLDGH